MCGHPLSLCHCPLRTGLLEQSGEVKRLLIPAPSFTTGLHRCVMWKEKGSAVPGCSPQQVRLNLGRAPSDPSLHGRGYALWALSLPGHPPSPLAPPSLFCDRQTPEMTDSWSGMLWKRTSVSRGACFLCWVKGQPGVRQVADGPVGVGPLLAWGGALW